MARAGRLAAGTVSRFVAFLRAVNVGGRTVKNDRLRAIFADIGLGDAETFIASGNVVFTSRARSEAALRRRIERGLDASLGFEVDTFLRTEDEVAAVAAREPFSASEVARAHALQVGLLYEPLTRARVRTLKDYESDTDAFHAHGREVYWLRRAQQSRSDFSNAVFEKALDVRATFRGMNTIQRMVAKFDLGA